MWGSLKYLKRLIRECGIRTSINGSKTAFVLVRKKIMSDYKSAFPNFKDYTGDTLLNVMLDTEVSLDDVLTFLGDSYRVFKTEKEIRENEKLIYCDVVLYKDDFDHDVSIFRQTVGRKNLNVRLLEIVRGENEYLSGKARVNPIDQSGVVDVPIYGDTFPSHLITMIYEESMDGIKKGYAIECSGRFYEILYKEKHRERNKLMLFYCKERLEDEVKIISNKDYSNYLEEENV